MSRFLRQIALLRRLSALGADFKSRTVLTWWGFLIGGLYACSINVRLPIRVRVLFTHEARRIELRTISDLWVLKEVLLDNAYAAAILENPREIIDLGANSGITAVYFADRYRDARVHAVEPNPLLSAQLNFNASSVPQIIVHHFALADIDGPVTLRTGAHTTGASITQKQGAAATVQGVSGASLLKTLGIAVADLIKFDIEGAEQYLLSAPVPNADMFIGEVHYDRMSLTERELRTRLAGYECEFRPSGKSTRSILVCRKKTLARAIS